MAEISKLDRRPGFPRWRLAKALLVLVGFGALQIVARTSSAMTVAAAVGKPPGSFLSAELPGVVERSKGVRDTVVGAIEHATVRCRSGDAALSITASTLPGFVLAVTTDGMLYRKARNELLESFSARATSWSECTHAGFACRNLRYAAGDRRRGMARLYLHGDVLVVINAVYGNDENIARQFLASVR